jgi:hypothetical protein
MSNAGKTIAAVLLIGLGLLGLGMSLCGGAVSVFVTSELIRLKARSNDAGQLFVILAMAGASLTVGLLAVVGAVRGWQRFVSGKSDQPR